MSADAIAAQIAALNHIVNVAQIYVASTTSVLVWDWLACIPQEIKYIWRSEWSPIKVLYIMVRYYTLVVLVVTDVWFFASWQEHACAKALRILPGIAVVIDFCVELVLAFRVYALYERDNRVGAFLGVLLQGFLGVMIAVPILSFDYIHLPSWPGPCLVTGKASIAGPKFIIAFYASPMCLDLIFTLMTVYRLWMHQKRGNSSDGVLQVFLRDGMFYFVAISGLNLINVIFFIQKNELIQSINAPMSIQLSTVLCCRLILNLRATRDGKRIVKKFNTTLGRWVDDFHVSENEQTAVHGSLSLQNRSGTRLDSGSRGGLGTNPGIMVRWEREVYDGDSWDKQGHEAEAGESSPGAIKRDCV